MDNLRQAILTMSRSDVEQYFSSSTRSQYLGNNTILCKILGNKKFFAMADDVGFSSHMIFDGYWEYWLTQHFCEMIQPGDIVLDIGANLGYYSLIAADLVGASGKVVAIEPNPHVFNLLTKTMQVNGYAHRVTMRNYALGSEGSGGVHPFFVPTNEPKNGRFVGAHEDMACLEAHGTVFDVQLGNLADENLGRVDFIKIDVEGAEIEILRHLHPIIEQHRPRVVCEVNFARGYSYDDVRESMLETGELQHLDFDAVVKPLTKHMAANERFGEDWLVCAS